MLSLPLLIPPPPPSLLLLLLLTSREAAQSCKCLLEISAFDDDFNAMVGRRDLNWFLSLRALRLEVSHEFHWGGGGRKLLGGSSSSSGAAVADILNVARHVRVLNYTLRWEEAGEKDCASLLPLKERKRERERKKLREYNGPSFY